MNEFWLLWASANDKVGLQLPVGLFCVEMYSVGYIFGSRNLVRS